ncbi:hypothetical protein MATL_G00209950 [Megalops atlanticus]|uniref:Ankyrin repeat domain 40 n=1 Tax=Megalops atlanticus TaxID=7932 RepID=A0A9D3SXE0_MEGAT|nr:hypothetical protein MATL_G00209950 [Megalops atlanticus]
MSTPSVDKELQERLREASAIGDLDEVRTLVETGVNVNSQNEINGWTCLHWACKRNHKHIVAYLLNSGADKDILTSKDELAVQLTSKPDIRRLLGMEEDEVPEVKEPELPIIANYLSSPPFLFGKAEADALSLEPVITHNGAVDHIDEHHGERSPSPVPLPPRPREPSPFSDVLPQREGTRAPVPVAEQNGVSPGPRHAVNGTLPADLMAEPCHTGRGEFAHAATQHGPVCPPLPPPAGSAGPQMTNAAIARQQPVPQQLSCTQAGGSMPAFQPFFFTSTFPVNVQELVLKVRIQNPNARENDFIEVELDRRELTYRSLLRVCCRELDISVDHVEKIRKLPNTMLRKDKDVARLQDFQELEVVLEKAEGLSLLSTGGQSSLTDRPCYNMKASRLTY